MSAYAYICRACDHRVVVHTSPTGDEPFRCKLCSCDFTQDSPVRLLSKAGYEEYKLLHPEDIND